MNQRWIQPALVLGLLGASSGTVGAQGIGITPYPGAEPRPEVARAIETYYESRLASGDEIEARVWVTSDPFEDLYAFYGPRMDRGKWGWREKTHVLEHQTRTLAFMRENLGAGYPAPLAPFFGPSDMTSEAFRDRLGSLLEAHPDTSIQIVEGSRRIQGDPDGAAVRLVVERPFVDAATMRLVDQTRITAIRVDRQNDGTATASR